MGCGVSEMEKKHVFKFKTMNGELVVGTDDIDEFSRQSWVNAFFGHQIPVVRKEVVVDTSLDVEMRAQQLAQKIVQDIMQKQMLQQQAPQAPVQSPIQRPVQPQQPLPSREDYLSITPDKISEVMWDQLTPQEQEAYTRKYMIK